MLQTSYHIVLVCFFFIIIPEYLRSIYKKLTLRRSLLLFIVCFSIESYFTKRLRKPKKKKKKKQNRLYKKFQISNAREINAKRKRIKGVKNTDHKIRQGDEFLNDKPLDAITKKAQESSHEHDHPQWEIHEGHPRTPPKCLSHV